jgi:type 1 fimbria pilin
MNPRSEFFIFNSRSDAETSNTVCNVLNPQLEANFGDIMYDSVDGAQKELSLQIQCQAGNGYAKVSTTGYNANDGIRLREDGSLNALVMVNNAPADFTASLFIEKNTTRNVPIIVTLKKTPALKGGIFSASMVFNVSYD